ncbi:MAG: thioredoxin family protein [Phycisphaerales bacterium]|nr:thioredoxin family protein [Phycisphaerales bacterium]
MKTINSRRFFPALLGLMLAILLPAAQSSAQPAGFGAPDGAVTVSAIPERDVVSPGSGIFVAVVLNFAETYHAWPNDPKLPPELEDFLAIPTTLEVGEIRAEGGGENGVEGVLVGETIWPEAKIYSTAALGIEAELGVFKDRTVVLVPLYFTDRAAEGVVEIPISVSYQACDDEVCYRPTTVEKVVELRIAGREEALAADANEPELFQGADSRIFARMASGEGLAPTAEASDEEAAAATPELAPPPIRFLGFEFEARTGIMLTLLLAVLGFIGGFALNLTPCVLPVIPIKIMTISSHAATPGKSLVLGLAMALGIVAFWVALSLPVVLLAQFTDPSRLFGIWWITVGIGVLILLMGAGLLGLFQINLPQSVYMVNPKADNLWGSFLFGVMTGVLGLPCFGFVVGGLLPAAAVATPDVVITIFASLGVGMAFPYLLLAAKPGLVNKVPRGGPAGDLVKQVMGLLLMAAAAYFIGAGLIALVSGHPYLGRKLHWWAVAIFVIVASLWMVVRTFKITKKPVPRVVFTAIGVLLGGVAYLYVSADTASAREQYLERERLLAEAGGEPGALTLVSGVWLDYSPALLEKARDEERTIVMHFTAEWCLICQVNKRTILDRDPVRSAVREDGIISIVVNLDSDHAPGWDLMAELGQTGIPLLVVEGPGLERPWMSNGYTPEQVLAALGRAKGE